MSPSSPSSPSPAGRPNVLLVVMDTARADAVFEGVESGELRTLSRLASEGTLLRSAHSTAPWTVPSHASLFSGQRTSDHGTHAGNPRFDPSVPTLAERLSAAGYRTGAVSGNPWVGPAFGFDRGFDDWSMQWDSGFGGPDLVPAVRADSPVEKARRLLEVTTVRNFPQVARQAYKLKFGSLPDDSGGRRITDRAVGWMRSRRTDRPWFLFLNYLEPHIPYSPPDEFLESYMPDVPLERIEALDQNPWTYIVGATERTEAEFDLLRRLYRASLAYLDGLLGELVAAAPENTVVCVLGDHGENIGDHRLMDHQYCLYETLTHVPLVVRAPEASFDAAEEALVETRDLYRVLGALAGADPARDGETTDPDAPAFPTREATYAEYVTPIPSMENLVERTGRDPPRDRLDHALRAVRTARWKLVERDDGAVELYDLDADPDERENVADAHPDRVADLRESVASTVATFELAGAADADGAAMSDDTRERLENLGYL